MAAIEHDTETPCRLLAEFVLWVWRARHVDVHVDAEQLGGDRRPVRPPRITVHEVLGLARGIGISDRRRHRRGNVIDVNELATAGTAVGLAGADVTDDRVPD